MIGFYIVVILILLQFKHLLADWMYQSEYMLKQKGTLWAAGGLDHAAQHILGSLVAFTITLVVFSFQGHDFTLDNVWWCVAILTALAMFDGVVHYMLDYFKARYAEKDPANVKYWWALGFDQTGHQMTYLVMAAIAGTMLGSL